MDPAWVALGGIVFLVGGAYLFRAIPPLDRYFVVFAPFLCIATAKSLLCPMVLPAKWQPGARRITIAVLGVMTAGHLIFAIVQGYVAVVS